MKRRIAVLGMGQMGSGMAGRLVEAGHDVVGYDINPATRAALTKTGMAMADSIKAALAGREIILTSLPDPTAVRAAWLGAGGLIASADPGSLCIELSTIDPATMREVGEAAAARGLDVVDCPVSGSPAEARLGKLVLIAGGERQTVNRAEPILLSLGETWKYTGGVGTAKVVKLVNNMMSMGNVLIACEAFALGTAAGVEAETLYDVLSVSGGRSHHFTKRFPMRSRAISIPASRWSWARRTSRSPSTSVARPGCRHPAPRRYASSSQRRCPRATAAAISWRCCRCIRNGPSAGPHPRRPERSEGPCGGAIAHRADL